MERVTIEFNGQLDSWGYQRSNIRYALRQANGKPVTLVVNSLGGSANEALEIMRLLEQHGDVTVEFVGFNASAATFMAYGAKKVQMHEDAFWLVHRCSTLVEILGNKNVNELEDIIKELQSTQKGQESIDNVIAAKYLDRCQGKGKTLKDVIELMEQERWMGAQEVLEWGLVDELLPPIGKKKAADRGLIVENCAALNLPMPEDNGTPSSSAAAPQTLMGKVISGAKQLLHVGNKNETESGNPEDNTNNNQNQNPTNMNKTFVTVLALLSMADGIEEKDGKVTLSVEQLQTLEDALKASQNDTKLLKEAENALNAISDNIKKIDGVTNKVNALAMVVNMVPAGTPAMTPPANSEEAKEKELTDSAVDPVNKVVRGEEDID